MYRNWHVSSRNDRTACGSNRSFSPTPNESSQFAGAIKRPAITVANAVIPYNKKVKHSNLSKYKRITNRSLYTSVDRTYCFVDEVTNCID